MLDQCQVRKVLEQTSDDNWDEATGTYTPIADEVLYEGPCTFGQGNVENLEAEGGGSARESEYWFSVPLSSEFVVEPELLITLTAIHPEGRQDWVGQTFSVEDEVMGTFSTSRRLRVTRRQAVR